MREYTKAPLSLVCVIGLGLTIAARSAKDYFDDAPQRDFYAAVDSLAKKDQDFSLNVEGPNHIEYAFFRDRYGKESLVISDHNNNTALGLSDYSPLDPDAIMYSELAVSSYPMKGEVTDVRHGTFRELAQPMQNVIVNEYNHFITLALPKLQSQIAVENERIKAKEENDRAAEKRGFDKEKKRIRDLEKRIHLWGGRSK